MWSDKDLYASKRPSGRMVYRNPMPRNLDAMRSILKFCRSDYMAAIGNINDLIYMERRNISPKEQVRKDHCNTMVDMIDEALK